MYLAKEIIIFLFPSRFVDTNKISNDVCSRVLIENVIVLHTITFITVFAPTYSVW